MTRNKTLGAFLALMVLLSGVGGLAGMVGASHTQQFDGTQADSADQTNTTYVATNSDLDNFTVEMTEDQSVSAGGSQFFETNVTPQGVTLNTTSGSGTASVNVVDDGYYINETGGTSSVTVESHYVEFAVNTTGNSSGNVSDFVNVSYENWMENDIQLIQDPDATENHTYLVYARDKVVDVNYEVVDAEAEFNTSAGELEANGSDTTGQFVFHVTRNNTTYENIPLSVLKFEVGLNTTYFSDISETTSENVDTLVLENVATEDGKKVYTWAMQKPDNGTLSYDIAVNATMESGEFNDTLVHSNVQDPDGGVQTEADTAYDLAAPSGIVSPNFSDIGDIQWQYWVIGIGIVIALIWGLTAYQDPSKAQALNGFAAYTGGSILYVWIALVLVGLTMVADFFLGGFNFWSNLASDQGLPEIAPLIGGAILVLVALGLNAKNSVRSSLRPIRG